MNNNKKYTHSDPFRGQGQQGRAIQLLQQLISTPSFSKEENKTADIIENFFKKNNVSCFRTANNVWAINKNFDKSKPCILLNSHHDTVKPNKGYTLNPFEPIIMDGKLFGLGSNDAGGALVALIETFLFFNEKENLKYNLVIAATAEEEISGTGGVELLLNDEQFNQITNNAFKNSNSVDFPLSGQGQNEGEEKLKQNPSSPASPFRGQGQSVAIVGEPTQMQMAIAERGLMVLDCIATGKSGHAARKEGDNALYKAIKDIDWFRNYTFLKVSEFLGPVQTTVTVIETENKQHNVVPSQCRFTVDVRVNELYSFEEVLNIIQQHVVSEVKPRSTRLRSSTISIEHPLVQAGIELGRKYYGSPTTSDKALMPFPALKMGPGDSARSHTADEFIYLSEIEEGIELYIQLLQKMM